MSNCYWQDLVERVALGGKDYCTENVPGDGNCYFHCISAYAYGNTLHSREYRREVCTTIFNDWEQWEHKDGLFHGIQMTRYLYWGSMLKLNGWAANCETEATSFIYGLRINVWLECPGNDYIRTTFGIQNSTDEINLLIRNNHFQLLHEIPINGQSTSNFGKSDPPNENFSVLNDHTYEAKPESTCEENVYMKDTFHTYCFPEDADNFETTTNDDPCVSHFELPYFMPSNAKKKKQNSVLNSPVIPNNPEILNLCRQMPKPKTQERVQIKLKITNPKQIIEKGNKLVKIYSILQHPGHLAAKMIMNRKTRTVNCILSCKVKR